MPGRPLLYEVHKHRDAMTLLNEYTTFKEPQFQTKGLSECKAVIVDDDKSSLLVLAAILQDIIVTEYSDNIIV